MLSRQTKPALPIRYGILTDIKFVKKTLTEGRDPAIITFVGKVTYSRRRTLWKTL